jgi:purine-nucleoside/S-methyl-5'-thioadenosine phosphorylase / adenosine deaminase
MLILKPSIFKKYPEIIFGFSTKIGLNRKAPYYFNTSFSVGDNPDIVKENRKTFYENLGLSERTVAYQRQIHSDIITFVDNGGNCGESDAMITVKKNFGLAISTADCVPVFIYDKPQKIISAVHSGWRGTEKKILLKTLEKLKKEFNSKPEDLIAYMGPSISQANYEVGIEVADKFDKKYLNFEKGLKIHGKAEAQQSRPPLGEKHFLDVAQVNYDILTKFGVKACNIQRSGLCTFEMSEFLHSYRRDGKNSGRSLGIIAMRNL